MSNNGYWFGSPLQFISTSAMRALHGQQFAVHWFSSKCGTIFPQSLRAAWFLRCCASWIASLDARCHLWQFLGITIVSIWSSLTSSGETRKHRKDCFSSTASAFQSPCRNRLWQQTLWSEERALSLLGFWQHLWAIWAPGFTSDEY